MIALSCENISLSFGTDVLFENVSFALNEGDKLGIIGVNGAGKSTLFRIIRGELPQDSGSVYISKDKTIGVLTQNCDFESDKTILGEMLSAFTKLAEEEAELEKMRLSAEAGNLDDAMKYPLRYEKFIAAGGLEYVSRSKGVLQHLGFGSEVWDTPIKTLSGGQKTRVALARIILTEPDIIMLDEPTNHLDIENIEWLEGFLAATKKTVIIISHDRYFLCAVTNKTLEIENKKSKLYQGNYDKYAEQKKRDRDLQEHHFKTQQKEIARIEAHIEQQRRWGREKNIIRAESRQKQLDKIERIDAPDRLPQNIRMRFSSSTESGNDVVTVKGLSKDFPMKKLFSGVSFDIKKNDRAFIIGANGCGKSTLLKILYGTAAQSAGDVKYGYNVKVGYYDQEHHNISEENTVIDELWNDYGDLSQTVIRNTLALFLFKGDDVEKPISVLSGGEKARISLAKLMLSKVNLLLLDEPTNHLDIMSREVLEDALTEFDGTIIAVSHDRYFIRKLSTRILSFNGGSVDDFIGGYDDYLTYSVPAAANGTESAKNSTESDAKREFLAAKQAVSERKKNERRLEKLRSESKAAEEELEENNRLIETEAATDHVRLSELYERNGELENSLLDMWDEIEKIKGILGIEE